MYVLGGGLHDRKRLHKIERLFSTRPSFSLRCSCPLQPRALLRAHGFLRCATLGGGTLVSEWEASLLYCDETALFRKSPLALSANTAQDGTRIVPGFHVDILQSRVDVHMDPKTLRRPRCQRWRSNLCPSRSEQASPGPNSGVLTVS